VIATANVAPQPSPALSAGLFLRLVMNPFAWDRRQLAAWPAFCVAGALCGLGFAWLESPFHALCSGAISGEFADDDQAKKHFNARAFQEWAEGNVEDTAQEIFDAVAMLLDDD
jgi:hypothetical protein